MLAQLIEELGAVPNDAVGLFLAAQSSQEVSKEELLVQALREHRRVMAVSSIGPTIVDLVENMTPFRSTSGEPAVLLALASERRQFFEEVYGTTDFEDCAELYAPAVEPLQLDGAHFDVVTRCISGREPQFIRAIEHFLGAEESPDMTAMP